MGQGPAGDVPLKKFKGKYKKKGAVITMKKGTMSTKALIQKYVKKYELKGKFACVVDIRQDIEMSRYTDEDVNGNDMYECVKTAIEHCLELEGCEGVFVANDNSKTSDGAKICYWETSGKRRLNKKPMRMDKENPIVITNLSVPKGDNWTSMKMNPVLGKQINWYFADRFMRETQLNGKIRGRKFVEFDNCIKKEELLLSLKETSYYIIRTTYLDGCKQSTEVLPASSINEGENAMPYFSRKYPKHLFWITTDVDSIYIVLANEKTLNLDKRKILIIKNYSRKKKGGKSYRVGDRFHVEKERFTDIFDSGQLVINIKEHFKRFGISEKLAVYYELFTMLIGGGDYVRKPFYRVGYEKVIYEELSTQVVRYKNLISLRQSEVYDEVTSKTIDVEIVWLDVDEYKALVENVYRRKSANTWSKNYDKHIEKDLVTMRQMMFYLFKIKIISLIVNKYGFVPLLDPIDRDPENGESIWGYTMKKIPGAAFEKVVVSSDCISEEWGREE